MLFPLLALVTWLWLLPISSAIEHDQYYITIPSTVTADVPVQATLNAEVHNYDTDYCHAFRVYLASSFEDKRYYFYNAECYLIFEQTLCDPSVKIRSDYVLYQNTTFNVTIPADVGPSGNHYVLIGQTMKTDGSYYGAKLQSLVFDLEGGTGEWASYQREGHQLWGDDALSCTGFSCVKECAEDTNLAQVSGNDTVYHDCANSCPNVSIDFGNWTYGGQPTAPLTTPSPCPIRTPTGLPTTVAATATDGSTISTRTRRVAGAVDTGAASRHGIPLVLLPGLAAVFL